MLNEIIDPLHKIGVVTGIHCCGNTDWSILTDTNVDIINFDAYDYSDGIMLYPEKINGFLKSGKYLAWGIVPTSEEKIGKETANSLLENLVKKQEKLATLGVEKDKITNNIILTPSCGTGSLSETASEKIVKVLKELSELYKEN